jgi:hypothetical protein
MAKTKKDKEFDLKAFIIRELRRAFRRSPLYSQTKNRFKADFFETTKTGKKVRRVHYKCAHCGGFFLDRTGNREIAVDHIEPVIDTKLGWVGYESFVNRLFCSADNLQILCNYKGEKNGKISCHAIKTLQERSELSQTKKQNKERQKNGDIL